MPDADDRVERVAEALHAHDWVQKDWPCELHGHSAHGEVCSDWYRASARVAIAALATPTGGREGDEWVNVGRGAWNAGSWKWHPDKWVKRSEVPMTGRDDEAAELAEIHGVTIRRADGTTHPARPPTPTEGGGGE